MSTRTATCGIIPACAGSTGVISPNSARRRDHPRVRGEHPGGDDAAGAVEGSSPRARGARTFRDKEYQHEGIIPACAGSTSSRQSRISLKRDHPRVRGEHIRAIGSAPVVLGSSPRARGAQAAFGSAEEPGGDHPRVRGEHHGLNDFEQCPEGSSPRARGALPLPARSPLGCGIIPACAGSTSRPYPLSWPAGDHPRVRGEHDVHVEISEHDLGSSPRARGARRAFQRWHVPGGIIPACAGSTLRDLRV